MSAARALTTMTFRAGDLRWCICARFGLSSAEGRDLPEKKDVDQGRSDAWRDTNRRRSRDCAARAAYPAGVPARVGDLRRGRRWAGSGGKGEEVAPRRGADGCFHAPHGWAGGDENYPARDSTVQDRDHQPERSVDRAAAGSRSGGVRLCGEERGIERAA